MLNKNDCMSILVRLGDAGINIDQYLKKLALSKEVPLDVLKFIASNQGIEILSFYEHIRKNYNNKRSPLYINIVKDTDADTLTTLSSLLNQILLYANKIENEIDRDRFYKEARAEEITRVLNEFFVNGDLTLCKKLLKLIKSDLFVLEYINDKRELQ